MLCLILISSFYKLTGTTVLHTATSLGSCSATKRLLNGGAWPLYQCKSTGSTPLHLAASTGNPETLSILLESIPSCDIDIRDNVSLYLTFYVFVKFNVIIT